MTNTLMNEIADAKQIDLIQPASQLLKLHCLKTKLKNCLTTDLVHDIDASKPTGLSHKDGISHLPRQGSPQANHLRVHH
jgi:hypothetical protein